LATPRHLGWRYEQEDGLSINEAANQPRAGDAHDLRPCPRYPHGAAIDITRRHFVRWYEQMAIRAPGSKTAFERLGRNTLMPQPGADTLAQLQTLLAHDDDGVTFKARCRARDPFRVITRSAWNQPWIGCELIPRAHVNDNRRLRQADQTRELRNGDLGGRRHGRPPRKRGKGRDVWAAASRGNRAEPLKPNAYHDGTKVKTAQSEAEFFCPGYFF
jgi:hypothetical protein